MLQKWIVKSLKSLLLDPITKDQIFRAIDRAVKDTKSPVDDKAAEVFKAMYDVIVGVL